MKNGDMSAIPFEEVRSRIHGSPDKWINHKGLTKRETMAMHMMPTMVIAYHIDDANCPAAEIAVRDAVIYADLLLTELERTAP